MSNIWRKMSRQTLIYILLPIPMWFVNDGPIDAWWAMGLLATTLMWCIAVPFSLTRDLKNK